MPKTTTPLRPYVRRDLRVGDLVEWYYARGHTQEGKVLELLDGGAWASVRYGPEEYVTTIETCRLRILRPKDGHITTTRDKAIAESYKGSSGQGKA